MWSNFSVCSHTWRWLHCSNGKFVTYILQLNYSHSALGHCEWVPKNPTNHTRHPIHFPHTLAIIFGALPLRMPCLSNFLKLLQQARQRGTESIQRLHWPLQWLPRHASSQPWVQLKEPLANVGFVNGRVTHGKTVIGFERRTAIDDSIKLIHICGGQQLVVSSMMCVELS